MYFISEELGAAYEITEGGLAVWVPEDNDFTENASSEEAKAFFNSPSRRVSCDEAFAFARAKAAESGAEGSTGSCN